MNDFVRERSAFYIRFFDSSTSYFGMKSAFWLAISLLVGVEI